MRLRSVFKMRTSILNTAITEQMGCIIFSFFVYIKSTNQDYSTFNHIAGFTVILVLVTSYP
nr:hypothetical protein [uncultured Anaerobutyricum sp.]